MRTQEGLQIEVQIYRGDGDAGVRCGGGSDGDDAF